MGNVPAWIAAGISAAFGFLSWRSSRRSKKAQEAADKAAANVLAAQREIAAGTKRLADATEREWEAADEKPWTIERNNLGARLRNLTATPKYRRADATSPGVGSRGRSGRRRCCTTRTS
jgi:type II secretory pathway pseudopilin PulG